MSVWLNVSRSNLQWRTATVRSTSWWNVDHDYRKWLD